jgi:hypothetical protein
MDAERDDRVFAEAKVGGAAAVARRRWLSPT